MDQLQVGNVVPRFRRTVLAARVLDRVQRQAHGGIADGMEVSLEATPIELHRGPTQQ